MIQSTMSERQPVFGRSQLPVVLSGSPLHAIVSFFKGIYRLWMRFAHLLGIVNRFIFLTIFYWIIVDISNICVRLARQDLLDRRMVPKTSYWHRRQAQQHTYKQQF
jgi:hypothetical protein